MIALLFRKFPKWAIAGSIILVSTTLFLLWWINRDAQEQPAEATPIAETGQQTNEPVSTVPTVEINPESMFIGDSSLYQIVGNEVQLVAEDWLEEPIGANVRVVYLPQEEVLVVTGKGGFTSFDLDGKRIGRLTLSNGAKLDGYLDEGLKVAVFQKDRDIWTGDIDWRAAKVVNERQITNTGFFIGSPFFGKLIGASDKGLVYRDARLGMVWVDLETGKTESGSLPATLATAPGGRFVLGDTNSRPFQLVALDIDTGQTSLHEIPTRIPQSGIGWIGQTKAAVTLGSQIMLYDHSKREMTSLLHGQNPNQQLSMPAPPSPEGNQLLVLDQSEGLFLVDIEQKQKTPIPSWPQITGFEWLGGDAMLLIYDVPDTDLRGSWLFASGDTILEKRLFAAPLIPRMAPRSRANLPKLEFSKLNKTLVFADTRWCLVDPASGTSNLLEGSFRHACRFE